MFFRECCPVWVHRFTEFEVFRTSILPFTVHEHAVFHSWEDTLLCYKKITREYRLVRDINFITRYEVSHSVLLRCTRTDTFVNNRNMFSNPSALFAQTLWVRAGILLDSRSRLKIRWRFWRCFLSRWRLIASFFGITWFLINSLKTFARKLLISRKPCRPTLSENV